MSEPRDDARFALVRLVISLGALALTAGLVALVVAVIVQALD